MTGVEDAHGADFSNGIPAAYSILGALLESVIEGLAPDFELVKLEGDAVFAAAPATRLDGQGDEVLGRVATTYGSFIAARTRAIPAATMSARPARRSPTSTSRSCSTGASPCARRSGPAATCSAPR